MAFLSDAELSALRITRIIFHVVGPDELILLEEFEPQDLAEFFLDRVRSANDGIAYVFNDQSAVEKFTGIVEATPDAFVAETKALAQHFQALHTGLTITGAFMVIALAIGDEPLYALIKFDYETVVSYVITETEQGKVPELSALTETFAKSESAIQKSALIRVRSRSLTVHDRNVRRVSKYFEQFLGATRVHQPATLTKEIEAVVREVALKHKTILGDRATSVTRNFVEAVETLETYSPNTRESFLATLYGPLSETSPVRTDFERAMAKRKIEHESFDFDRDVITRPIVRRLKTLEGIRLSIPLSAEGTFEQRAMPGNRVRIIIETGSIVEESDDFSKDHPRNN